MARAIRATHTVTQSPGGVFLDVVEDVVGLMFAKKLGRRQARAVPGRFDYEVRRGEVRRTDVIAESRTA